MLVCKIELWPSGDESRKREIGRVHIANVGGDKHVAEYKVELGRDDGDRDYPWKHGRVTGFRRLLHGPYDLLMLALVSCIGTRHGLDRLKRS